VRLVSRVDVSVAVLRGQPLTMFASLIEVLAVANDLRAKPAVRFDLDRVRALGYADDRSNSEESSCIGDRLSMVSGGGSDDTAASLVVGQLRHQIDPTADLEGADRLMVLVFDPGLRANQLVERRISIESRGFQVWSDPLARRQDVVEAGNDGSLCRGLRHPEKDSDRRRLTR